MNILGIDLGGTNVRAGLVENECLGKVTAVALKSKGSESETLAQIEGLIEGFGDSKIDGIGIGVPSIVDVKQGIVFDVVNIPSWKEVPLKYRLEKRFGIPVYVNNDANCFVAGEKFFGKARRFGNIVGVVIGTGLGAGLIINDKLYAGPNCGAGEFGMIPWREGILEDYCSGKFFKRACCKSGEQVSEEALRGEQDALEVFSEFGHNLGRAIEIIMLSVDPEIIVLGGSVSKSFAFFRNALWESLGSFPYPRMATRIVIEVSELDNASLLGAAALYYDAASLPPQG